MAELAEMLDIVRTHPDKADFVGPRSEEFVRNAELALDLTFPPTYRRFLRELGAGGFGAEEFYGVIDDDFEHSGVPDGIWYTLRERVDSGLPHYYAVVYSDGMGGLFVLDTSRTDSDREAPVYVWVSGMSEQGDELEYIDSDFGSFALDYVRTQLSSD